MRDTPTTVIGVMHAELRLAVCGSLKEKRSVLRPCIHTLQDEYKLAVAEVGDQDIWRSAILAVAAISGDKVFVERALQNAQRYLETRPDFEVIDLQVEIL